MITEYIDNDYQAETALELPQLITRSIIQAINPSRDQAPKDRGNCWALDGPF